MKKLTLVVAVALGLSAFGVANASDEYNYPDPSNVANYVTSTPTNSSVGNTVVPVVPATDNSVPVDLYKGS